MMLSKLLGKRGRPPEQIQEGGYDNPIEQHQFPDQNLVSLEDSKQLPVQPVREFGQDIVMENINDISSSSNARQDDVMVHVPRQDNMISDDPKTNQPGGREPFSSRPTSNASKRNLHLEGPTRKPRHASVFSTHSDKQAVPAIHCIQSFKGNFSTRASLKRTDTLSTMLKRGPKTISTR